MGIYKTVKVILVVFAIGVFLSVPLAIFFVRFDNKTELGKFLKAKVIKYPKLISLLDLNEPGDGRYLYISSDYPKIRVNIYTLNNNIPDERVGIWMGEIISESVGKEAVISAPMSLVYENKNLFANEDLNGIRDQIAGSMNSLADLNLVYVSKYFEKPTSVGLVLHRDTIFLFKDALEDLSEKGYVEDILEKTTIMHEWGHLLGVEHINSDYCIMSERVEVFDNSLPGKALPKEYCWEELEEIRKIKKEIP